MGSEGQGEEGSGDGSIPPSEDTGGQFFTCCWPLGRAGSERAPPGPGPQGLTQLRQWTQDATHLSKPAELQDTGRGPPATADVSE